MMQQNDTIQNTTPTPNYRKWIAPGIIIIIYLLVSYPIMTALAQPINPTQPCGMGLFFAMVFHFILAVMVTTALLLIFHYKKGYPLIAKIVIISVVSILPFISYFLF